MRIAVDKELVQYTRNPHSGLSWEEDETMPTPYREEDEPETESAKPAESSKPKDSTHGK